jgi:HK97 gp10 family phage protein
MTAKVEGLEKLQRKLQKLAQIQGPVRRNVRASLEQTGGVVSGQMRAVAPEQSGALRASIRVVFGAYKQDNANVRGVGGDDDGAGDPDLTMRVVAGDARAWYAALVEFGTPPHINGGRFAGSQHPGATARPFFFPVWRANKRSAKSRMSRAMRKGIQESLA